MAAIVVKELVERNKNLIWLYITWNELKFFGFYFGYLILYSYWIILLNMAQVSLVILSTETHEGIKLYYRLFYIYNHLHIFLLYDHHLKEFFIVRHNFSFFVHCLLWSGKRQSISIDSLYLATYSIIWISKLFYYSTIFVFLGQWSFNDAYVNLFLVIFVAILL